MAVRARFLCVVATDSVAYTEEGLVAIGATVVDLKTREIHHGPMTEFRMTIATTVQPKDRWWLERPELLEYFQRTGRPLAAVRTALQNYWTGLAFALGGEYFDCMINGSYQQPTWNALVDHPMWIDSYVFKDMERLFRTHRDLVNQDPEVWGLGSAEENKVLKIHDPLATARVTALAIIKDLR